MPGFRAGFYRDHDFNRVRELNNSSFDLQILYPCFHLP